MVIQYAQYAFFDDVIILCDQNIDRYRHRRWLTFQVLELVLNAVPFFGVWQWLFADIDHRPLGCEFCIEFDEMLLTRGHIILGKDGFSGTLRFTQGAINAFIRVDYEKIGTFVKTVNGTDIYAVRVFTLDTVLYNNVSHDENRVAMKVRNITIAVNTSGR